MGKKPLAFNKKNCSSRCNLKGCSNLKRARVIDLSGCDLDAIPVEMLDAKGVRRVNLSNNNISSIENLDNARNIEYLNLGVNKISNISGLHNMTQLKTLRLHDNNIKKIIGLKSLNNLENLDLRYNDIEWIDGLSALNKVKKIALDGNPLISLQERRLIDIGFEFGDVGYSMREREIARDVVEYSKSKDDLSLIDSTVEDMRRLLTRGLNSLTGVI